MSAPKDMDLEGFDQAKRDTMRRMVKAAAFAVPVVASFSVDSMTISRALAGQGTSNGIVGS